MRPSEKLKLVAQPIKFPIGSLVVSHSSPVATATTAVVAGNIRDSTLIDYRYSAAALVDLQLSVDAERGVAIVVTVWRAVATRLDRDEHRHEEVVFEGLVCRSVLQLADLRAQEYTPPGSTGVGPRRAQELLAADNMEIVLHSAAHDRYRLFAEDRVILRQAEDAWGSIDLADQKSLARAEGHLKVSGK